MASDVDICNLALAHLGQDPIQSLTQRGNAAAQCNAVYKVCVEAVLRGYDWKFASTIRPLSLITDETLERNDWSYAYTYPPDCLAVRELVKAAGEKAVPFDTGHTYDDETKVIFTSRENAKARYTRRITNPELYPADFVVALSWYIAATIALPVTRKRTVQADAWKMFSSVMPQAQVTSANEGTSEFVDNDAPWITGR